MNNQEFLKQYLKKTSIIIIISVIFFLILQLFQYQKYVQNTNQKINAILMVLKNKYPKITKNELIELLTSKKNDETFTTEYGIDIKKESIILKNDFDFKINLFVNFIFFLIVILILLLEFFKYNKQKDKKIEEITGLIKEINRKNYQLNWNDITEDELSILKHEIYKVTLMLKEQAEILNQDKQDLKEALSNISHQLKTPLTSILIMLDNLLEYPEMDKKTREDFILDIKRNIIHIYFLVESILKLSKLDSNTVHFIKEPVLLDTLLKEAIANVQPLCDLKEIQIVCFLDCQKEIVCDKKWQIEAFTNILKNSIEHSKVHSKIEITTKQNHFYTTIFIKDFGNGISKTDLPHIFKRFYKGQNASEESIGIGLALSKKIIESNNGKISVATSSNGTIFQIQYFYGLEKNTVF